MAPKVSPTTATAPITSLMPNANGIKKGSYHGQLGEVKEKIINIIGSTLKISDGIVKITGSSKQF